MSLDNQPINNGDNPLDLSGRSLPSSHRSDLSRRELLESELIRVVFGIAESQQCPRRANLTRALEYADPPVLLKRIHSELNADLFVNEICAPTGRVLPFQQLLDVIEHQLKIQSNPGPLHPGQLLRPLSLVVDSFLARGSRSVVYLANAEKTGEMVVVKAPIDGLGGSKAVRRFTKISNESAPWAISPDEAPPDAVFLSENGFRLGSYSPTSIKAALRSEAAILSRINHPGVVGCRCLFETGGTPYLVLDYIQGGTLRQYMRAPQTELNQDFFLKLVRTLMDLKGQGLKAHGALSPDEIMINEYGDPVLLSPAFRSAGGYVLRTSSHYNPRLLEEGQVDVMALGIIFYELRTGKLPFGNNVPFPNARNTISSDIEWMEDSRNMTHRPVREWNNQVPVKTAEIIYNCLTASNYKLEHLYRDLRDNPGIITSKISG